MRWVVRGLMAVGGLFVLALAVIYGGSEWVIRKSHAVPMAHVAIPHDAASIAEGGRLARIASCRDCHGANGQGKVMFEIPMGRVATPPLAVAAADLTDDELVRVIRQGVHKDGSSLFVMPTGALSHLSDEDVGRIVAWIRTLKPGPNDSRARTAYGPLGRALILAGKVAPQAISVEHGVAKRPADAAPYFVSFTCQACHQLHADAVMEDGTTKVPALAPIAAAYDPAKFKRLLHDGVGASKADLGLMSEVAQKSFSAFTDDEVVALQAYLKGEAEKAPAQ